MRGTYATTIVSSSMLRAMAERHGVGYAETLTGFKWISRAAPDLVFGYEEALGYAVAPDLVRDKDGISAALLVAECAAAAAASAGSSLLAPARRAGRASTAATPPTSSRCGSSDLSLIADAMARLRADPPPACSDEPVTVEDLLPDADVVRLRWPTAAGWWCGRRAPSRS